MTRNIGKHEAGSADGDRRRGRISREAVIAAAVALADEKGTDAVTIRRLAERLGVRPMSLYHYFPTRDAIVDGMVDAVFAEIHLPVADAGWREGIRARATSAREVLRRHPWATPLLDGRVNPGPATLADHDAAIGCLRAGGLTMTMVAHAIAAVDAYVYGFAIQEAALPFGGEEPIAELAEQIMAALPADRYPHLVAFTTEHVMRPGYRFGDEFEFGLDLVLDGIERAHRDAS